MRINAQLDKQSEQQTNVTTLGGGHLLKLAIISSIKNRLLPDDL
jgi:hypothetical protein